MNIVPSCNTITIDGKSMESSLKRSCYLPEDLQDYYYSNTLGCGRLGGSDIEWCSLGVPSCKWDRDGYITQSDKENYDPSLCGKPCSVTYLPQGDPFPNRTRTKTLNGTVKLITNEPRNKWESVFGFTDASSSGDGACYNNKNQNSFLACVSDTATCTPPNQR